MSQRELRRWIDVTIRDYVDQRFSELELRIWEMRREVDQRFQSQERFDEMSRHNLQQAVSAAQEEARRASEMIERQMDTHANAHAREHQMTEDAISKAERMMADRLQALADATQIRAEQAGEIVHRSEYDQLRQHFIEVERKFQEEVALLIPRQEYDQLREQVAELSKNSTPRSSFDETRRLVYMGLGMAILGPILISALFFAFGLR